ncbi:MAG TPA: hypothetical protein VHX59_21210 [Mycobacteriales bacterium]|nr:hypothetical protein [Mycobacteriales bacterium]
MSARVCGQRWTGSPGLRSAVAWHDLHVADRDLLFDHGMEKPSQIRNNSGMCPVRIPYRARK